MPCFDCYEYGAGRAEKRKRIERDLIRKGLDPRSLKFSKVLYRRLRRP